MTTTEMISGFKVGYDIANLEGPGYEDAEILILLNQAQIIEAMKEIAIRRYTYISNIITNELGTLGAGLSYTNTAVYTPTNVENYIGYISSKSKIKRVNYKTITAAFEWMDNVLISKEKSGLYVTNTLNKPILLKPRVYEDEDRTITIIYDRNTSFAGANDFYLEYLRRPVDITAGVNCELNEILHERVVNTAVDLAKKVLNVNEAAGSVQTDILLNRPK